MSWVPFIVLVGSGLLPVAYYLSSSERNEVGRTGVISIIFPLVGLLIGVILILLNIASLLANPLRLVLSVSAVVSLLYLLFYLIPRVIGVTTAEFIINRVFG